MNRILSAIIGSVLALGSSMAFGLTCDLTTLNSSCSGTTLLPGSAAGGTIFQQGNLGPTGSGVFPAMNRIDVGANPPIISGYNTPNFSGVFQDKPSATFQRVVTLDNVPTVTINGTPYRQFLLDINQVNSLPQSLLSLTDIQLFTGSGPSFTNNNVTTFDSNGVLQLTGGTLRYRLAPNGTVIDSKTGVLTSPNVIKLDANLQQGSGHFDMVMLIPNSVFAGLGSSTNLILYSRFGDVQDWDCSGNGSKQKCGGANNDGFEEWALRASAGFPCLPGDDCTPGGAPEPGTLALLGVGLAGLALRRRQKISTASA